MTKQRRVFSAEFKREAADLVLKQNYSFIEASRSLGISESALRRCVGQLQQERTDVTQQSLVVFGAYRLRLRQPDVITAGMDFQRQSKPSNRIVARPLLDKGVLQPYSLARIGLASATRLMVRLQTIGESRATAIRNATCDR